jgi:hypothetical protein
MLSSLKSLSVGMGLASNRLPTTRLPRRLAASPIPTEQVQKRTFSKDSTYIRREVSLKGEN